MERVELFNRIKGIFEEKFSALGYVFVDINASRLGRRIHIRLAVDRKEGGININECADINRGLSAVLDTESFIEEGYILEVSSPGVDRPLTNEDDFRRNLHHNLRVILGEAINKDMQIEGELLDVKAGGIVIKSKKGTLDIPFDKINKAKQIIWEI